MACVGCNPSDADAKRDDPTMWRVMGFAFRWGFGGVVPVEQHDWVAWQHAGQLLIHAAESGTHILAATRAMDSALFRGYRLNLVRMYAGRDKP